MSTHAGILVWYFVVAVVAASTGSSHPCERPCLADQPPSLCHYVFTLQTYTTLHRQACGDCPKNQNDCFHAKCITANGKVRTFFSVNNELPGPTIQVCRGDTIDIQVRNRLPAGSEGALHWHGISQKDSPYMDGVPMLTQCPVPSGADFHYRFLADQAGTHYYHAHSVLQQEDGVYGALIVRDYSFRFDEDQVLIFSAWNDKIRSGAYGVLQGNLLHQSAPSALLMNGRGVFQMDRNTTAVPLARVIVSAGKSSLLRLVNAAAFDCPVHVTLHSHRMRILRVADAFVKPVVTKSIQLYPGERYDVEVYAQKLGKYLMHVHGSQLCQSTPPLEVIFEVRGTTLSNETNGQSEEEISTVVYDFVTSVCPASSPGKVICSLELEAFTDSPEMLSEADMSFSLPFGRAPVGPVDRNDHEFRFVLDDVVYYPTFLQEGIAEKIEAPHLNHVAFRLPASPPLVHPEDEVAVARGQCESLSLEKGGGAAVTARRPSGTCRELPHYLSGNNDSAYAMHLHGHKFVVLAWRETDLVPWNYVTRPILRDTVVVPRGGAVMLRLHANNPGFWLLEAREGYVPSAGVGVAAVLQVGQRMQMSPIPKDFPKCSGIRPNDVIF